MESQNFDIIKKALFETASRMMIAIATAPKARGMNNLETRIIQGDVIKKVSEHMKNMAEKYQQQSFSRDADNILCSQLIILVGTKIKPIGLKKCGLCGFKNCEEKEKSPNIPCSFNTGDLGIAIGSAVSIAMDNRVDNRIMYTVGLAAMELGLLGEDIKISYGIPLSATSKNPFFDRK